MLGIHVVSYLSLAVVHQTFQLNFGIHVVSYLSLVVVHQTFQLDVSVA